MRDFVIQTGRILLQIFYWLCRLIPTRAQVCFLSRQADRPSMDFMLLTDALSQARPELKVKVLCRKARKGVGGTLRYCLHILRQTACLAHSRVCVIDSYIVPVSMLRHRAKVLQLWHAVGSVKRIGYQAVGTRDGRRADTARMLRLHRNYDAVLSGSEAMRPVFAQAFRLPQENILVACPPKIEYLRAYRDEVRAELLKQVPLDPAKKTVLYAPTYRRGRAYRPRALVRALDPAKYNIIVKAHPAREMRILPDGALTCPNIPTFLLLPLADAVITDYSAVSIEAAALDKPVYLYVYDLADYEKGLGLNIDLAQALPGCLYDDPRALAEALRQADYPWEALRAYAQKYVTDIPDGLGRIRDWILERI